MSDPFLGQIMPVPYSYAPMNWAFCLGQILQANQNQALFALLGARYGGNGQSTFGLPDLRGRTIIGVGQQPGGSNYVLGETGGKESQTLNTSQMPMHTHAAALGSASVTGNLSLPLNATLSATASVTGSMVATTGPGQNDIPQAGYTLGDLSGVTNKIYAPLSPGDPVQLAPIQSSGPVTGTVTGTASQNNVNLTLNGSVTVQPAGGAAPVATVPPFMALNVIIATQGIWPPQQ
jgi:microcystin-dependent protein